MIILDKPMDKISISRIKENIIENYNVNTKDIHYFFLEGIITNNAYKLYDSEINILSKDNKIKDLIAAANKTTISALSKTTKKIFLLSTKKPTHLN